MLCGLDRWNYSHFIEMERVNVSEKLYIIFRSDIKTK